jgi:hypothetical protein
MGIVKVQQALSISRFTAVDMRHVYVGDETKQRIFSTPGCLE